MKPDFAELANKMALLHLKSKVEVLKAKVITEQKSKSYYKLAFKKSKELMKKVSFDNSLLYETVQFQLKENKELLAERNNLQDSLSIALKAEDAAIDRNVKLIRELQWSKHLSNVLGFIIFVFGLVIFINAIS